MSDLARPSLLDNGFDLESLVDHRESVSAGQTLEQAYVAFKSHAYDFAAAVEGRRYVGTLSRGRVGFLLGARFGFALYAKQPVSGHLIRGAMAVRRGSPLMAVLNEALCRTGHEFYDDAALLDEAGDYLGMISVRRLIGLQSRIVSEQSRQTLAQQAELAEANRQLFRSLNELRQSQGRYEALLKNSALGIALLNNDGAVEACNPRTEVLIGPVRQDGTGHPNFVGVIAPNHRAAFLELLQQHEEKGGAAALSCEREFNVCTDTRGERLFRFFTTWIAETGQICVQFHDITDQRILERQVALNEKAALFESLVGGIAHELNNKLSPVLGFAGLLSERLEAIAANDDAAGHCGMILESANEAAKLVRQLLQLSRPAAVDMATCDLGEVIGDAGNVLSYRLRETGTQIEVRKPAADVLVVADAAQIKQVLINLMMNAMDAMEAAPTRHLSIETREEAEVAVVTVSDTGHGIRPEHLNRVFDPFFTTKEPNRGTGLGLCVCWSIVRQHRGEIQVDSTVGVGTRFHIRLPLAAKDDVGRRKKEPAPAETGQPAGSPRRERIRAMIVDDEQFVTALVQEVLRRGIGWQVERVPNGRHAIERLEREDFDVLISDVRMPEVDGLALYRWIRERRPALAQRTLFVTGDAGSAALTRELHALGRPVLHKPFTPQMLVDHCARLAAEP
jgi:two-component system NtrC family sensor kinase